MMLLRDGTQVVDQRCGRMIEFDPRSRGYSFFAASPPDGGEHFGKRQVISKVRITDPRAPMLDQKHWGACGLIGAGNALNYEPGIQRLDSAWCINAYHEVQVHDQFPGPIERDGGHGGTSLLAVVKWLKSNGYIKGYTWAFSLEEVLVGIGYYGAAIFGFEWTRDMIYPSKDRFCRPTGGSYGGHCVAGTLVNTFTRTVEGPNWPGWNLNGFWKMTWGDLENRLHAHGECVFLEKV